MTAAPQDWFTAAELAALRLTGVPASKRGVQLLAERQGWNEQRSRSRQREGRGGGTEYHFSLLPPEAQAMLAARHLRVHGDEEKYEARRAALHRHFDAATDKQRAVAAERLVAVSAVMQLEATGLGRETAITLVGRDKGLSRSTLWSWVRLVRGWQSHDWCAALLPSHAGRTTTADCDPRAWQFLLSDYLRQEEPAFSACYRRMVKTAKAEGWSPIPSAVTLRRRIDKEIPVGVRVRAREGADAGRALFPHQTRDRSMLHALQAVNIDGHKVDVMCKFEDGVVARPMIVVLQDLYSGMILAWRLDRTENKHAVRLAIGDMVEQWGIPEEITLDNGRAFASKDITGRTPNRFRFKVKDEDHAGLLTQMQVRVHWAQPYNGQAKPIERAFRDLCEEVARHPACAGAYTGNSPENKPANYGSRAMPIADMIALLHQEIDNHNTRTGRRSAVCQGRSIAAVFAESYEAAVIRKPTVEQLRRFMLAGEAIGCNRKNGEIQLFGNRYWCNELTEMRGRKVLARFDPEFLQAGIAVYAMDGRFIAEAPCLAPEGFYSAPAAKETARRKAEFVFHQKRALAAYGLLKPQQVADLLPQAEGAPRPDAQIIRMVANGAPQIGNPFSNDNPEFDNESLGRALRARAEADILAFPKDED